MSTGSTRSRSRRGPATVHAASLLSLQLWAISELRDVLPPLGERARTARLLFLGLVAALFAATVLSYPLGAFIRWGSVRLNVQGADRAGGRLFEVDDPHINACLLLFEIDCHRVHTQAVSP